MIEGCHRCRSTVGHRHVSLVNRKGQTVGQAAVCDLHAPEGVVGPEPPKRQTGAAEALVKRRRKLEYDRARRRAIREMLDRHADEYEEVLKEERSKIRND